MAAAPDQISGSTRFTAILGDPVAHSLSPAMHNAAYRAGGLDRRYLAFQVPSARLADALRALPALGIVGVNLTVPHKERGAELIAKLSDEARLLGAINCVVSRTDGLLGYNTDARGLQDNLASSAVELVTRRVVIIGAGGAAAAALLAAIRLGAGEILLCNRSFERADSLARRLGRSEIARAARPAITALPLDALRDAQLLAHAALIINATSLGLSAGTFLPLAYAATDPECVFYDLIYGREATLFLKPALAAGRRALDGAGMLINQAELAFELFNGVKPRAGVMRAALMSALGRST
jgi:shikimate dehydrogenase